jgi:hypothetical protein
LYRQPNFSVKASLEARIFGTDKENPTPFVRNGVLEERLADPYPSV